MHVNAAATIGVGRKTFLVCSLVPLIVLFLASATASGDAAVGIQGFRAVADVATCAQFFQTDRALQPISETQRDASCQQKYAQGLMLFSFVCAGCNAHDTWVAHFLINNQVGSENDIVASPNLDAAWTVRPNQIKPSDCVAVSLTDIDASPPLSYQSTAICSLVASTATSVPMSVSPVATAAPATPAGSPLVAAATTPPQPDNGPASPSGVEFTNSTGVCAQHAGRHYQICVGGLFFRSTVFLVWDPACNNCSDGYDVYSVDPDGTLHRVDTVLADVSVVSLSKDSSDGHCFTVRAYKGTVYSQAPQPVCYKK